MSSHLGNHSYGDIMTLNLIDRNMFFLSGVCSARDDFLHFFSAAVYRNAGIPHHGNYVAAMLTDEKSLFHEHTSFIVSVCPFQHK